MVECLTALWSEDEATSAMEYAILVSLIAAFVVFAIKGLGNTVNTVLYSNVNSIIGAASGS